eukprot:TRINITY_DN2280_c0_g1_i1.p1 TRINITY_DN2280_c0_g1~~TRINITY_DN2280_c0_g1_i1.p1  ORF type:complete len:632 (+),score=186.69 TRINITY_DN2280_c0_g1_i1:59-1954(+)
MSGIHDSQSQPPIWSHLNHIHSLISAAISTKIPSIFSSALSHSLSRTPSRPNLIQSPPDPSIRSDLAQLSRISGEISSHLEDIHGWLGAFACEDGDNIAKVESSQLHQDLIGMFAAIRVRNSKGSKDFRSEFEARVAAAQKDIERIRHVLGLVEFIRVLNIKQLGRAIFSIARHVPLKDISNPSIPNWPAIEDSLMMIKSMSYTLRKELNYPGTSRIASDPELKSLITKLHLVSTFIFNSTDLRSEKRPIDLRDDSVRKLIEDFGLDLARYRQKVDRSGINIEMYKDTQYAALVYRDIVQKCLGYAIRDVKGDGNCFFRSVARSVMPLISQKIEDVISLNLRKKVNVGKMQSLEAKGENPEKYAFYGFVIPEINDSIMMARPGIWADHIQLQKISKLLSRPLNLLCFDDFKQKLTNEGKITPGPDFTILPPISPESSIASIPIVSDPIWLFFTPLPGHYEALVLPRGLSVGSRGIGVEMGAVVKDVREMERAVKAGGGAYPASEKIVHVYLRLENEVCELERKVCSLSSLPKESRPAAATEIKERGRQVILAVSTLHFVLQNIGLQSFLASLKNSTGQIGPEHLWDIYGDIVPLLFRENELLFDEDEPISTGEGPLSFICQNVYRIFEKAR